MKFGHDSLDVYKLSIRFVCDAFVLCKQLEGVDRHARDQLLRASQSIPLNNAEGNGKGTFADRRRFFEIARGSSLESAAFYDDLVVNKVITKEKAEAPKEILIRIVSIMTKLGHRQSIVNEKSADYGSTSNDYEYDNDNEAAESDCVIKPFKEEF